MKERIFSVMFLIALPLLMSAQMAIVPADSSSSPCNRHYITSLKVLVNKPTTHLFTINATGGTVIFSSGNLQYCPARNEWRFALRQFDRVGNGKSLYAPEGLQASGINGNITTVFYDSIDYTTSDPSTASGFKETKGVPCNNLLMHKKYEGWVDLFSWGTSGHGRKVGDEYAIYFYPYELNGTNFNGNYNNYGYGPSYDEGHGAGATNNDIDTTSGTNRWFDWGYGNVIREYSNCVYDDNNIHFLYAKDSTMYRPGIWRTLTLEEWKYLLISRIVDWKDSAFTYVRLQYGKNESDTITGMLLYPDDFSFAEVGLAPLPFGNNYKISVLDAYMFSVLEEAGCVFLPNTFRFYMVDGSERLTFDETVTGYWTTTAANGKQAFGIKTDMSSSNLQHEVKTNRKNCHCVRLVQDYSQQEFFFSVGASKKVRFSPGNLQYCPKQNRWRFAEHQYDRILNGGAAATVYWDDNGTLKKCNNLSAKSDYAGWLDLFAWGTSGVGNAQKPYTLDQASEKYSWSDWGKNAISGFPAGMWRTPTQEEWDYLFNTRKVNGGAGYSYVHFKFGPNAADTVTGVVIYPDNFTWAKAGVSAIPVGASAGVQTISMATWESYEKAGCVFLPSCRDRYYSNGWKIDMAKLGHGCGYWSSNAYQSGKAYIAEFDFSGRSFKSNTTVWRYQGRPVRLIR